LDQSQWKLARTIHLEHQLWAKRRGKLLIYDRIAPGHFSNRYATEQNMPITAKKKAKNSLRHGTFFAVIIASKMKSL